MSANAKKTFVSSPYQHYERETRGIVFTALYRSVFGKLFAQNNPNGSQDGQKTAKHDAQAYCLLFSEKQPGQENDEQHREAVEGNDLNDLSHFYG